MADTHQVVHPHTSFPEHAFHEPRLHWNLIWSAVTTNIALSVICGGFGILAGIMFRLFVENIAQGNPLLNTVIFNLLVWMLPVFVFVLTMIFVHNHAPERAAAHTLMTMIILLAAWMVIVALAWYYWAPTLRLVEQLLR